MKIMFIINSMNKGGAERVVSNLSNFLVREKKCDVSITMLEKSKIGYQIDDKISIFCCCESKPNNKLKKINSYIKEVSKLKKILKNIKPDIIISFLSKSNFVMLKANVYNIPMIITVRNALEIELPKSPNRLFAKLLYPRASAIIYQTEEQSDYLKKMKINIEDFAIIPNPINENFSMSNKKVLRSNTIVSVGRLEKQKNHKLLIDAIFEIHEKIKEFKVVIYGEGSLRKELQSLIDKYDLSQTICLYGTADNINEKIVDSSLFVMTSDYEGMPNSLMEAMALGLPVISTDCPCGGPKFLINSYDNGILIPVNDKEALKQSIIEVLSDKNLSDKIAKNAKKIYKELNPVKIYNDYYNFIYKIYKKEGDKNNEKY